MLLLKNGVGGVVDIFLRDVGAFLMDVVVL